MCENPLSTSIFLGASTSPVKGATKQTKTREYNNSGLSRKVGVSTEGTDRYRKILGYSLIVFCLFL